MRVVHESHLIPGKMLANNMNHQRYRNTDAHQSDRGFDLIPRRHLRSDNDKDELGKHVAEHQPQEVQVAEAAPTADNADKAAYHGPHGEISKHGRRHNADPSQRGDKPAPPR